MRVFELYFNPKKGERTFESFVYDPESLEEKRLGSLCVAGELEKVLPQNSKFLNRLSLAIKNEFYSSTSLQETLKIINDFLDKEVKSGNVNWLGNLDLAILNFSNSILNFTKVGGIKILLVRDGELLNLSENLEFQDTEPDPMKIFSNVASGKLSQNDKIFILTGEIFGVFTKKESLLAELLGVSGEKELKSFFRVNKHLFSDASGICLALMMDSEGRSRPRIPFPGKRLILGIALFFILGAGFLAFKGGGDTKKTGNEEVKQKIEEARSKILMGENFLIFKDKRKAQAQFQIAWDILSPINTKESASLKEQIEQLRNSVSK